MLVDLSAATLGAPQSALDIDVAELLVACCVLVGPERALREAVRCRLVGDSIARVLPYLQRAALTPHLRDLARHPRGRPEGAPRGRRGAPTGTAEPEIAPLRRVRPKDVLTMAALIVAAYLLISQLAEIGFDTIADELGKAEPAWVVVALILAQSAFIGSGISVRGAVPSPLALLPCVVLQSAIKFINLTVPSSAGRIGMNLRFLQRMGVPRAQALAAGAVDDVSETMVQAALFLICAAVRGRDVDTSQFARARYASPRRRSRVALVVSVVAVLAVPKLRDKVVPGVQSALSGVWSVARDRRKRIELFGGNVLSELTYALALGATCLAYGVAPQPGPARLRQHGGVRPLERDPGRPAASAPAEASPRGRPHRDGRRRVDRVRRRHHAAPLHLLPPADLGLLLAALAQPARATSSSAPQTSRERRAPFRARRSHAPINAMT